MRKGVTFAAVIGLTLPGPGCVRGVVAGEQAPEQDASTDDEGDDSSSTGAESGADGPRLDVGSNANEPVNWLLNSENGFLHHIDRESGHATELCELVDPHTGESVSFSSMTFTRDDRLFGSGADELWEITLPDCDLIRVGYFGFGVTGVNGITPDEAFGLFAVDSDSNSLYRVDPDTAEATLVGYAGYDIGFGGATWVESAGELMAIDANSDSLYRIDTETGEFSLVADLTHTFGLVGFEYHPHGGELYGCTGANGPTARGVYRIHLDGSMNFLGDPGFACNDLAAPWATPDLPTP